MIDTRRQSSTGHEQPTTQIRARLRMLPRRAEDRQTTCGPPARRIMLYEYDPHRIHFDIRLIGIFKREMVSYKSIETSYHTTRGPQYKDEMQPKAARPPPQVIHRITSTQHETWVSAQRKVDGWPSQSTSTSTFSHQAFCRLMFLAGGEP